MMHSYISQLCIALLSFQALQATALVTPRRVPLPKLRQIKRHEDDAQTSNTLHPDIIQDALNFDGIDGSDPNVTPSLTSNNNFINFCLTQPVPLTNGKQVQDGSCNPTPFGRIIAKNKMPSGKFQFPKNFDVVEAGKPFTVQMAIRNMQTGVFSNSATNYLSAPQTANDDGIVIGHSHVVIQAVSDYDDTEPLDPAEFAFFKGMNRPDVDGVLSAEVTEGLEPGVYKMSSIHTAINHTPVIVAVAQHASLDDTVYFEVLSSEDFNDDGNGSDDDGNTDKDGNNDDSNTDNGCNTDNGSVDNDGNTNNGDNTEAPVDPSAPVDDNNDNNDSTDFAEPTPCPHEN